MPLEARGAKAYLLEYASALFWESLLSLKIFFTRGFDVLSEPRMSESDCRPSLPPVRFANCLS